MNEQATYLKERKEDNIGGLGGRKAKGEMMQLYYNFKNKIKNFKKLKRIN